MSRWISKIRERARGLTPGDLAAEAIARFQRATVNTAQRLADRPGRTYISGLELEESTSGAEVTRWPAALTPGLADLDGTVAAIKRWFPGSVDETILEAEAILRHRIRIFESVYELGERIDWRRDPGAGVSWPMTHYSRVPLRLSSSPSRTDLAEHPTRGPDVRVVWELNRLHHLTTLGRAYALSREERFAEEFLLQLASWYEQNPPRFGVNWAVAMEVAIRAINLIAAAALFRGSRLVTEEPGRLMMKLLLSHGRHIWRNLEYRRGGSSNHYLSNLIGLFVIGMMNPQFTESLSWVEFSAGSLLEEMDQQVLTDGVDYEGSTGYHRLVLEIYALFFLNCRTSGVALPERSWTRLGAMFDFVRHYLKPDGTAPLIGDSDDGRIVRFKEGPAINHSYLLSLGALLFEDGEYKSRAAIDEEAVWWFGQKGIEIFDRLSGRGAPESQAYSEARIFVQRARADDDASGQQLYAIIDCGDSGVRGHGSHAHCDALSLEVYAYDQTFLRDPGTFVYTGSERWRNAFRSTAYHNTVRVDGKEISELVDGWLFALGSNVRPIVNRWESTEERDVLDAQHDGYARLPEPIMHRRVITLNKREGYWTIDDEFTGRGEHYFEFCFVFDAGIELTIGADSRVTGHGRSARLTLIPASGHGIEVEEVSRWISLSYGVCEPARGVIYRMRETAPLRNRILIIPSRVSDDEKVERICRGAGLSVN